MSIILFVVLIASVVFLLSLITLVRLSLADRRARRMWQEQGIDRNL